MGERQHFDLQDRCPTVLDRYLIRKVVDLAERDKGVFAAIDCLMRMDDGEFRKALEDPFRGGFIFTDAVLIYSSTQDGSKKLAHKIKIRDYLIRYGEVFDTQEESKQLIEEWELV